MVPYDIYTIGPGNEPYVRQADLPKLEIHTLSQPMYNQLVKKLGQINITAETTAMQAGYILGIQQVLKSLREEGFVVLR
jgi:hypothetical protein